MGQLSMPSNRVLIIDDEADIQFAIRDYLEAQGYVASVADDCKSGLEAFKTLSPDVAIVDYRLPDGTVFDLLPSMQEIDPNVPILVLTGHGSIDLAVRAMKEGAEQFFTKPVDLPTLEVIIGRLCENLRNRRRQIAGRTSKERHALDPFEGTSSLIKRLATMAQRVAQTDANVLITGETGTGKGILARWLHQQGPRSEDPFVDLNCAGLSHDLLDSELFGHVKGAFTSALKDKPGLLEVANRGTMFLDEIGDMALPVQAKLLKVLEERRFRRLGDVRDRTVDVRLIAATHQDMQGRLKEGEFRQDLYYRINTIELEVPPLRVRTEDIIPLSHAVLRYLTNFLGRRHREVALDSSAENALRQYAWPGNVRELRNVLERALLLSDGSTLRASDFQFEFRSDASVGPAIVSGLTLKELEIKYIKQVLGEVGGKVPDALKILDIPKSSLYQKLKAYDIRPSDFRIPGAES
jgi:DNA-binding NtrC family response regulator